MYKAYTDGSSQKEWAGWAYIIIDTTTDTIIAKDQGGFNKHITEENAKLTNQQMELMAAIKACEYWKSTEHFMIDELTICSDSAYLVNCKNQFWYLTWQANGWYNAKRQKVSNPAYWKKLIPFFNDPSFKFEKVKGHSGDKYNEMVDKMAKNLT